MSATKTLFATLAVVLALALAAPAAPAHAAASLDEQTAGGSDYDKGVKAVRSEKYKDAIQLLEKAVQKDPRKADAWNYLGYSQRKTGQYEAALKSYTRALELDPKHKGAHEYLGELYLMTDNLPKAEEQLKKLGELCGGCSERKDLEKAVAAYKKSKGLS